MHAGTSKSHLLRPINGRLGRLSLIALVSLAILFTFGFSSISSIHSHGFASNALANASKRIGLDLSRPLGPRLNTGRLHLLVPATSSNLDLCKLVLSAQILGYPTPVLINYGDEEQENPYVQHLAKVKGLLNYLDNLGPSVEGETDMILIVDGYDVWFQLRPDVLLERYFKTTQAADERTMNKFGRDIVEEHDIRHTVVLGPDKICWPIDFSRPACWAVPHTDLPEDAFGPGSSDGRPNFNDPRWLNSGTIMGPADDVKNLLRATLDLIHNNYTVDSDQFYIAELFGIQEYARLASRPDLLAKHKAERIGAEVVMDLQILNRSEPVIAPGTQTEFHILVDGRSSMFQTLAFWKRYLTWMRARDSWQPFRSTADVGHGAGDAYQLHLGEDVLGSEKPFIEGPKSHYTWADVSLNTNVVTGEAPVLIHFTGNPEEKLHREIWWEKIWFQEDAEELRHAAISSDSRATAGRITARPISGRMWSNAESKEAKKYRTTGLDGVETDRGAWVSWAKLCSAHEQMLYRPPHEDFFHSWRRKKS